MEKVFTIIKRVIITILMLYALNLMISSLNIMIPICNYFWYSWNINFSYISTDFIKERSGTRSI